MIALKSEKNRGKRIVNRRLQEIAEEVANAEANPLFWYERGFAVTYEEMFKDANLGR